MARVAHPDAVGGDEAVDHVAERGRVGSVQVVSGDRERHRRVLVDERPRELVHLLAELGAPALLGGPLVELLGEGLHEGVRRGDASLVRLAVGRASGVARAVGQSDGGRGSRRLALRSGEAVVLAVRGAGHRLLALLPGDGLVTGLDPAADLLAVLHFGALSLLDGH